MDIRILKDSDKNEYNKLATHIMQSWQWGEFRKSLGLKLLRYGLFGNEKLKTAFQLTLHKIPFTKSFVGYLPKGPYPDEELAKALRRISKDQNCAFIKIEPDVEVSSIKPAPSGVEKYQVSRDLIKSPKPLFTKYNFVLDITKSEEQLLKTMHPKTRYNIRLAQKKGVIVEERTDDQALEIYLDLVFETAKRQKFYNHNRDYHRKVWKVLSNAKMARFLIAFLQPSHLSKKIPLAAWMLVNFKDTLYYPYGGSSDQHRDLMASYLVAWEATKLGKKLNLKYFDMWGALGPNPDQKDPWFGFHRFKSGFGAELVEYLETYDLVSNWPLYYLFTAIDKSTPLKVFLLKLLNR